ncbi:MAG: C1 family peptidase, partial [Candidatus Eisenbacteria bacterium]|nr:C1 family peptidase [Candidatus Eisenbacteria bacterium]
MIRFVWFVAFSLLAPFSASSLPAAPPPRQWCDNSAGLPPVSNQEVGGSCYAWAAAYYHLTYVQGQEFGWDLTDPAHQCSPAFVYNLTNGGVDNGASEGTNARADAFHVFESMGCATMADMPYSPTGYLDFPTEAAFRSGMRFRSLGTATISTRTVEGVQELKEHLLAGNTAVLGILCFANFPNIIAYDTTYCVAEALGSRLYWHDVCVVGFDDARVTADGIGAFRIVNSFGPQWGDSGFFWMSYEAVMSSRTSYGYVLYAQDRIGYEPALAARIGISHGDRYAMRFDVGLGAPEDPLLLRRFFDFNPMSESGHVYYPPDAAVLLDITDALAFIDPAAPNAFFIRAWDTDPGDGRAGALNVVWIEDMSAGIGAMSTDAPCLLPDDADVVVSMSVNWAAPPPSGLTATLDPASGAVDLAWQPPADVSGLLRYRVYMNGAWIDSTETPSSSVPLPSSGLYLIVVSAVHEIGESLQPLIAVCWENAYGIPFTADFEEGLEGWAVQYEGNNAPIIVDAPVHGGSHAVGVRGSNAGITALSREFAPVGGLEFDAWFNLARYPLPGAGMGGAIGIQDTMETLYALFIDGAGHLWYGTISPDASVAPLDTATTYARNVWYRHRLHARGGSLHAMVATDQGDVLYNGILATTTLPFSGVGFGALALNGGWNYFDDVWLAAWDGSGTSVFTSVAETGQPYAIVVAEALVDGEPLSPGDEIGIFDGALCVGAAVVDGTWPLIVDAWGSQDGGPGFIEGHPIIAAIWRAADDSVYAARMRFDVGDGTFGDGIFSRVRLAGGTVDGDEANSGPQEFTLRVGAANPCSHELAFTLGMP